MYKKCAIWLLDCYLCIFFFSLKWKAQQQLFHSAYYLSNPTITSIFFCLFDLNSRMYCHLTVYSNFAMGYNARIYDLLHTAWFRIHCQLKTKKPIQCAANTQLYLSLVCSSPVFVRPHFRSCGIFDSLIQSSERSLSLFLFIHIHINIATTLFWALNVYLRAYAISHTLTCVLHTMKLPLNKTIERPNARLRCGY